jgi:hypothetical protein
VKLSTKLTLVFWAGAALTAGMWASALWAARGIALDIARGVK